MNYDRESAIRTSKTRSQSAERDMGLRAYMLKIYNYMTLGLGITGVIAYFVARDESLVAAIMGNPVLFWGLVIAQFGAVIFLSARVTKMSTRTAQLTFFAYAALTGLTLSGLFAAYTFESLARVFFITSGTFGAMSLYGYTTNRDLTGLGSFLFMGLIGVIIASVVNMFIQSSALMFLISVIGVLVFVGLTAYDTQQLKKMYYHVGHSELAENYAVVGALRLYLDFINLFIYLLRFLGDRR
ncbi:MAG: Bax inhibitor-1/YccA family protein [Alphaproteobacteria bacterium]|nr:Bax inhibitor-1/YccA family protein [Alphaproteobacteria bacterium]NCQ66876.1 Bax inhibitor-1/YccA family protein [Alphaproteobacteria bacterium]NCT07444.1 Bax inhibitor-1/YccA family protein [Alphaproteobacteria bacterium]